MTGTSFLLLFYSKKEIPRLLPFSVKWDSPDRTTFAAPPPSFPPSPARPGVGWGGTGLPRCDQSGHLLLSLRLRGHP